MQLPLLALGIFTFQVSGKLSESSSGESAAIANDGFVHPVVVEGKHFIDSITRERFYIRGVDYQPGGSAAYSREDDPLSDVDVCARDIYLMQQLGINTVRVYTVNPKLSHSDCMTMLAAANIYLLLDVNSPLVSESINRYEPWTTYTPEYLRHVFGVIDQFSRYNNTLGFFIGNEIVNDERSAEVSPPYIRAVTRDVKDYMYNNCPRSVPLGYSAADDLRYRTQLPNYLTCGNKDTAVDFYGVNSYQWCGNQTLQTSGYDVLIKDHKTFDFPVMFSEFGCNHVQPRLFQEIDAIYSSEMTPYFDGGLVYEFTQESNDYGLVTIDGNKDAWIRDEFLTLQTQFHNAKLATDKIIIMKQELSPSLNNQEHGLNGSSLSSLQKPTPTPLTKRRGQECKSQYSNLPGAANEVPNSFGTDMIRNGLKVERGEYNPDILYNMPESKYKVYDVSGNEIQGPRIELVNNFSAHVSEVTWPYRKNKASPQSIKKDAGPAIKGHNENSKGKSSKKNDGSKSHSGYWTTAMVFICLIVSLGA